MAAPYETTVNPQLTADHGQDRHRVQTAGIGRFMLSSYPHLEEAYWFGEGGLPILERKGLWQYPTRRRSARPAIPFTGASSS
ncbi:hypothetical protein Ntsu_17960 [Nocardia sp. IFM 10818]